MDFAFLDLFRLGKKSIDITLPDCLLSFVVCVIIKKTSEPAIDIGILNVSEKTKSSSDIFSHVAKSDRQEPCVIFRLRQSYIIFA